MIKNYCIKCDVTKCRHNVEGCNCRLDGISVTCGDGEQCTRCDSYAEK